MLNLFRDLGRDYSCLLPWLLCTVLITGCASSPGKGESKVDPLENVNRKIYDFNVTLDRNVFEPVARGYIKVTPRPLRIGIGNFFENLGEVDVIVNAFLQGKLKQGGSDTARFVLNSTFGILGLFDVAADLGFKKHEEDFGQTLAVWGVGQGPYLVLPILGPATLRTAPSYLTSTLTNPLAYVDDQLITIPLAVLGAVDFRARAQGAIQFIDETALDPYAFTREAYLQRRNYLIYDGNPPIEDDLFEELEEELEEDLESPSE